MTHHFIEPLDVIFPRGNRLFGDAGSHGEALMPPWPSVFAGAVRSWILALSGPNELAEFAAGKIHPELGTPARPGQFTLSSVALARRSGSGVEALRPLPSDLVATRSNGRLAVNRLHPRNLLSGGIRSSRNLPNLAVLGQGDRAKPESGIWLDAKGWKSYLEGGLPRPEELLESRSLWKVDPRVGIGLHATTRAAADGRLFTAQAIALSEGVGFLVAVEGAKVPDSGFLRLGGDGRAAAVTSVRYSPPEPDLDEICRNKRCRLVLSAPGIFTAGWLFAKPDASGKVSIGAITGTLQCAALQRSETISGWDLAQRRPKAALRAVPSGSVYWLIDLDADAGRLRSLRAAGLWLAGERDSSRRAEGFNRFEIAVY